MRWTTLARALTAVAAVAVAAALVAVESERRACDDASRAAFLASRGPLETLDPAVDRMIDRCPGSEPLTRISVGLVGFGRPMPATRLARAAVEREPESYAAWAVLAAAGRGDGARAAQARARKLNPLAAPADGR
jgi:hypothetical protein